MDCAATFLLNQEIEQLKLNDALAAVSPVCVKGVADSIREGRRNRQDNTN